VGFHEKYFKEVFSSAVNIVEIWDKVYEKIKSGEDVDFADLAEEVMEI
jgi:MraZ protein